MKCIHKRKIFPEYEIVLKEKEEQVENKEKYCSTLYCLIYCQDKLCTNMKNLQEHYHQ